MSTQRRPLRSFRSLEKFFAPQENEQKQNPDPLNDVEILSVLARLAFSLDHKAPTTPQRHELIRHLRFDKKTAETEQLLKDALFLVHSARTDILRHFLQNLPHSQKITADILPREIKDILKEYRDKLDLWITD